MRFCVALIHKDANSYFGVSFPDFPGCVSAGSTLEEAVRMGAEALGGGHIELMIDEGLAVPEPTDLQTLLNDPENRDGVPVMIPADVLKSPKTVRVNVTLPEDILRRIDQHAERHGFTRSGFLAQAAKRALESA